MKYFQIKGFLHKLRRPVRCNLKLQKKLVRGPWVKISYFQTKIIWNKKISARHLCPSLILLAAAVFCAARCKCSHWSINRTWIRNHSCIVQLYMNYIQSPSIHTSDVQWKWSTERNGPREGLNAWPGILIRWNSIQEASETDLQSALSVGAGRWESPLISEQI